MAASTVRARTSAAFSVMLTGFHSDLSWKFCTPSSMGWLPLTAVSPSVRVGPMYSKTSSFIGPEAIFTFLPVCKLVGKSVDR